IYGPRANLCDPLTPSQLALFDGACHVQGISNSDAAVDTGYVMEMRIDLGAQGYDVTHANGDIVEFNISVYDCDWYWPINLARFGSNRAWWQNPWGRHMYYDEVQVWSKPFVTTNSGAVPVIVPDLQLHAGTSTINLDGKLLEPVWANADSIVIRWNDTALRASYPNQIKWRSGQFQPTVNGGQSDVFDPADATVKNWPLRHLIWLG